MAAIRHTLQREVFTPSDEKLLSVCFVSKTYKRKKTSFLCLATSTDSPGSNLLLYQVKKNDKNVYKKKQSWLLTDIQTVDGINNDSLEMELHIDKVYKWLATAAQERRTFISNLYTYSCALPQRPEFKNIPKDWLIDPTSLKESDSITLTPGEFIFLFYFSAKWINNEILDFNSWLKSSLELRIHMLFFPDLLTPVITSDYQPITDKELVDLTKLMANCHFAISNAELFMETLAKDLSALDGVNFSVFHNYPMPQKKNSNLIKSLDSFSTGSE